MKNENFFEKVISISVISLHLLYLSAPLFSKSIIIPSGTTVQLELSETVSSEDATVGQKVNLKVLNDIKIKGYIVIKGGSVAVGEINTVTRNGSLGTPGSIGLQVKTLKAIDGSTIPLSATKIITGKSKQTEALIVTLILCIFGIFIKGENADLQAGNVIEATILSDESISVGSRNMARPSVNYEEDELLDNLFESNTDDNMINIKQIKGKYVLVYSNDRKLKLNEILNVLRLGASVYETIGTAKVIKISGLKAVLEVKLNDRTDSVDLEDKLQ